MVMAISSLLKFTIYIVFGVLFFAINTQVSAQAPCVYYIDGLRTNPIISSTFEGDLTIKGEGENCFRRDLGWHYMIFLYPQGGFSGDGLSPSSGSWIYSAEPGLADRSALTPVDQNTFIARNVRFTDKGGFGERNKSVPIRVNVCTIDFASYVRARMPDVCRENRQEERRSVGVFEIRTQEPTPTLTPTPEPDLPKIPRDRNQCIYVVGETPDITVTNIQPVRTDVPTQVPYSQPAPQFYEWFWQDRGGWFGFPAEETIRPFEGAGELTFPIGSAHTQNIGSRTVCIDKLSQRRSGENCITLNFRASIPSGTNTSCNATDISPPVDRSAPPTPPCGTSLADTAACNTAIGRINVSSPQNFVARLFGIILGIAGIATIFLFIYSGYIFITSSGDKQKLQGARETITSAIVGLLFIIFSIALLEFLGVHLLRISTFG